MSVIESKLRRAVLTSAAPVTIIEPSRGWLSLNLHEIWAHHELLYFLVWRDVKVRYKQTASRSCLGNTSAIDDNGGLYGYFRQIR